MLPALTALTLILTILQKTVFKAPLLGGVPYVFEWSFVALVGATATVALKRRWSAEKGTAIAIAVFSVVAVVSTFLQIEGLEWDQIVHLFSVPLVVLIFGFVLPELLNSKGAERVLKAVLLALAILSFVCLAIHFSGTKTFLGMKLYFNGYTKQNFDQYSLYINRNRAAHMTQVAPAVAVFLFLVARGPWRIVWAICGGITLLHILFTFSRGAQLGVAISLVPLLVSLYRKNTKAFKIGAAVFAVAGVAFVLLNDFARTKYAELFVMRNRDLFWMDSFAFLSQGLNWVWGSGLWGYWPGNGLPEDKAVSSPHNSYLSYLLYFGVTGFSAFLYLLVNRLAPIWNMRGKVFDRPLEDQCLAFLALSLLVTALFDDTLSFTLYFPGLFCWFVLGLASKGFKPGRN